MAEAVPRDTRDGSEAVLATLSKGQSFDELTALQGNHSQASAEAATDCTVMHVDLNTICSCAKTTQEVHAAVLKAASSHMNDMLSQIQQLKVQTGVKRLANFLLELCEVDRGACALSLPFDKYLLAGHLGMKPESLSRSFSRLKPLGVATQGREVVIAEVQMLSQFIDDDGEGLRVAA